MFALLTVQGRWTMVAGLALIPRNLYATSGKSVSFPQDIRKKLIELEKKDCRRYPTTDLIPARKTLAQVLGDKS